jgi:hypothetical protein
MDEQKSSYWKFVAAFLGIMVLGLTAFVVSRIYGLRLEKQASDAALEALKKTADENYQKALADTYGGKTPQETLAMYIAAVEKGDYVLASKYFVVEKQEEEKSMLVETNAKGNIDFLLNSLMTEKKSAGYFSTSRNRYTIEKPIFIEFTLYPTGIWKIIEI